MSSDISTTHGASKADVQSKNDANSTVKSGMGSFAVVAGVVAVLAGFYYTTAQTSTSSLPTKLPAQVVVRRPPTPLTAPNL